MTTEELRNLVKRHPFEPFTVHLNDGSRLKVTQPDNIFLPPAWKLGFIVALERGRFSVVSVRNVAHVSTRGPWPNWVLANVATDYRVKKNSYDGEDAARPAGGVMNKMEPPIHRFWIRFDDAPGFFPLAFGVTAESSEEALKIIKKQIERWWPQQSLPQKPKVETDVDISELQKRLPLNHIGIPCNRGIWHPRVDIGSFYSSTV